VNSPRTSIAQRSRETLYFAHRDMDYYFAWITGREIYGGSERGECLDAAGKVVDGDAASWGGAWRDLAERVEAQARVARDRGDLAEARGAYLRACTYHRAPLFMTRPRDPAFHDGWRRMQSCFQQAAALFDPPIERVEVPYRGRRLPGYFWKVDGTGRRRPTLLVVGGIETFAEDCYFMIGPSGAERGYNVLTVDLPGQGMNPAAGLVFGARMETPLAAVIDHALGRPEVDPERLAVFGFSWGGHIVFRAARHDPRIRAMIANPPMPDVFRAVLGQQKGHRRGDPVSRLVFDQIVWRMGLRISLDPRDIGRRLARAYDYLVNGRVDPRRILCPTLCLAGEGEAPVTLRIARETVARLPHPDRKLVIFTREQGSEAHCQVDDPALPNGVMFDWLEQVLGRPA
jgi:pimeloyl-ACP methyl ester carboxylesterase